MEIDPASVFELPMQTYPDAWTENVDIDPKDRMKACKDLSHMEKKQLRMEQKMEKRERKAERKMEKKEKKSEKKMERIIKKMAGVL